MKLRALLAILTLVLGVAGCVPYPVYKTVQPAAQMTVLDEQNQPIEGAEVVLTTDYAPYGRPTEQAKFTDQLGVVAFEGHSEWQTEAMQMHHIRYYSWYWCAKKPGFKTYVTGGRSGIKFEPLLTIQLSRGTSLGCGAALRAD
jgi:hypothetical protein